MNDTIATENESVQVIEDDDGSGWVKVMNELGKTGLVPATYLDQSDSAFASQRTGPTSQGRSGERVRAIYAYQAQGADELTLTAGDVLELTSGPQGGRNYADGWWEGELIPVSCEVWMRTGKQHTFVLGFDSKGKRGIFPSNYVSSLVVGDTTQS